MLELHDEQLQVVLQRQLRLYTTGQQAFRAARLQPQYTIAACVEGLQVASSSDTAICVLMLCRLASQ
jgi:hypothetical protein